MPEAISSNQSKRLRIATLTALLFNIALFPINSMADASPLRAYPLLKSQFQAPPSEALPLPALPGSPTPWRRESAPRATTRNSYLDAPAQANSACQLKLEAKLPMTESFRHYTVPVSIGGRAYPMLIDTGAEGTAIVPNVADEWAFGRRHVQCLTMEGRWRREFSISSNHPFVEAWFV